MSNIKNRSRYPVFAGVILVISLSAPPVVLAQALEEIVVTAQRREQSLQDVPISIETISGDAILTQGYRNLDELAEFVPGLQMSHNVEEQNITIRGQGLVNSKALIQENSVPMFIDGVTFARQEHIRATFLDIDRMEVLRGPQPVYFGQSARAGAISVTTKGPTTTWEGDLMLELGDQSEKTIEVGVGGPIMDTLGIRVAGRIDQSDGFLRDVITDNRFPKRDFKVGRVTLEWTPMDNLTVGAKFGISDQRSGGDTAAISPREFVPTEDLDPGVKINAFAFGLPGVDFDLVDGPAEWTRRGYEDGTLKFSPVPGITGPNSDSTGERRKGIFDLTTLEPGDLANFIPSEQISFDGDAERAGPSHYGKLYDTAPVPERFVDDDWSSVIVNDLWNALLDVTYQLDNGMEIASKTAHTESDYRTVRGVISPFISSTRHRDVDFDMWSQEFRISSPTGGTLEWIAGLYWQLNNTRTSSHHYQAAAEVNMGGLRGSANTEDAEWRSAFASITYNFLDNRASVDLGARYTDSDKVGNGHNFLGGWVVEDPDTGDLVVLPRGARMMDFRDGTDSSQPWAVADDGIPNNVHPVLGDLSRFHAAPVVGRTPLQSTHTVVAEINDTFLDPQIVLRYRPTDNISVYAKWAQAFMAGSFESAVAEITTVVDDYTVGPENAIIWEAGARGSFLDGRLDGSITLFRNDVSDLQVSGQDLIANRRRTVNSGELRTEGVELGGRFLVTENWRVNLSSAFMRSEYLLFDNAPCPNNFTEPPLDALGLCNTVTDANGNPVALLDRSGQRGPGASKYHIVLSTDYTLPFFDNYKAVFNVQGSTRHSYTGSQTNEAAGLETTGNTSNEELNLAVTFGDVAERWDLRLYGRNVLVDRPTFEDDPELVIDEETTLRTTAMSPKDFGSYGVQFRYYFR